MARGDRRGPLGQGPKQDALPVFVQVVPNRDLLIAFSAAVQAGVAGGITRVHSQQITAMM